VRDQTTTLPEPRPLVRIDPYALREDEHTLMRLLGPPLIRNPAREGQRNEK
jgi:hypothetical protein